MQLLTVFVLGVVALSNLDFIESAKILAIFPYPGPSQYILVQPYLKALAARGHEMTVISAFPQKEKIERFRDITSTEILKHYEELIISSIHAGNKWQEMNVFSEFFTNVTVCILENERVQQLMRSKDEKFDLVIVETVHNDPLYGFAQHYNAPIIGVSSYGTDRDIDDLVGNSSPLSYIPLVLNGGKFTDRMNFWQRLENLFDTLVEWTHTYWVHLPHQVDIYRKYFPHAKANLMEVRKNFSLMLLNQHFTLSFPRPYVPNMIEVGGFHLNHKPSPLPKDMEAFINGSEHGVIYFSLGTNVKSKDLPREKLEILMRSFASLKEGVMWKFEDPNLPGKPKNVFISKWFPQPDILAHPKVKLFYTHGGLLSTIEAIYHGKPVVGMPMIFDQFLNVQRIKKAGLGLSVDFHNLNEADLKEALLGVLNNRKFADVAAKMSQRYHDQPMKPLDTAIYWTEYVLRHKGAHHMQVAAQDMNFIQFYSLDTAATLLGGIFVVLLVIIVILMKLFSLVFGKKASLKKKQKSQ